MTLDNVKRLLQSANGPSLPGGAATFRSQLELAWADAIASESHQPEGLRKSEAALLADLVAVELSPAARRLLHQVVERRDTIILPPGSPAGPAVRSPGTALADANGNEIGLALLATGALRGDKTTGGDPLVEAATTLCLRQLEHSRNPFASVHDASLLSRALDTHRRLYAEVLSGERLAGTTPFAQRHARAALLATMRLVAERLVELQGPQVAPELAARLVEQCKQEPHQPLRKFEIYRLLQSESFSEQDAVKTAEGVVFPPSPPYEQWAEDGVLRVQCYCDNDAGPWEAVIDHFRSQRQGMGMQIVQGSMSDPTQPVVLAKDVESADGTIKRLEVVVAPRPGPDDPPSLFEKIGDDDVDIIIYTGHAGYGQRVDAALRNGVDATGAGKLVMLFQCWGEGSIDSLSRAFPEAQLFSTTDRSNLGLYGYPIITQMLDSFLRRESWQRIQSRLLIPASRADASGWDKLFFTPATRQIIEQHGDFDQDGVAMRHDPVYMEPRADFLVHAPTGFNAVTQAVPTYVLDAAGAKAAVDDVSLILRYNTFDLQPQPPGAGAPLELGPESVVQGGFFPMEEGAHEAFRFDVVEEGGKSRLRVRANPRFAHAQPEELKNFLAFELGKQLAEWSGRSKDEAIAYGMAFYLQSLFHHQSQWEAFAALDHDAVEHQLFLSRYGLPRLPLGELLHSLPWAHAVFTPENIAPFVQATARWAKDGDGQPRPLGMPLSVPVSAGTLYDERGISVAHRGVENLVQSLPGYERSTVVSFSPVAARDERLRLVCVQMPSGDRRQLVLELNSKTGRAVAVHDLGATVDLRHMVAEQIALDRGVLAEVLWPDDPQRDAHATSFMRLLERELMAGAAPQLVARRGAELVRQTGGVADISCVFSHSYDLLRAAYSEQDVDELRAYLRVQAAAANPS